MSATLLLVDRTSNCCLKTCLSHSCEVPSFLECLNGCLHSFGPYRNMEACGGPFSWAMKECNPVLLNECSLKAQAGLIRYWLRPWLRAKAIKCLLMGRVLFALAKYMLLGLWVPGVKVINCDRCFHAESQSFSDVPLNTSYTTFKSKCSWHSATCSISTRTA